MCVCVCVCEVKELRSVFARFGFCMTMISLWSLRGMVFDGSEGNDG